jgi:hypothetical protein
MLYCFTIGKVKITIDAANIADAKARLARIRRDKGLRGRAKLAGELSK